MKLYQQLMMFVMAATMIPLLVGFVVLRHNERQLESRLLFSRTESANRLAEIVHRQMKEILERVKASLGFFAVEAMNPDEMTGFLGLLYKQSDDITQVALVDADGREMTKGVYLDHPERYPEYVGRLAISDSDHQKFLGELALKQASRVDVGTVVVGSPRPFSKTASLGLSLVIPWSDGLKSSKWFVCIEMSLARISRRIVEAGDTNGWQAILVDAEGRVIAHRESSLSLARTDMSENPAVRRLLVNEKNGALIQQGELSAFSLVPDFNWGVVLSQPRHEAWSEMRKSRLVTVIWTSVSILALLVLGGLFTGRITRNLRKFVSGAEAFGRGELDTRIDLRSKDELGVLASTFNQMGVELKKSREEIEAWNRELVKRVEERTRELEQAHQRLLETSKLAAIGQLGAGVAHEINNPLVGILGNVQLMMTKCDHNDQDVFKTLQKIESAAKRCRDVTQNLLRFSQPESDSHHEYCDLKQVLLDAYSLIEQQTILSGIETIWRIDPKTPKILGDYRQLMQVFHNLFANARTAMSTGGTLTISTESTNGTQVEVLVKDTGKGIPTEHLEHLFEPFFTTKDVWTNTGLGLSLAYRIISDHGGDIRVESRPGIGSSFSVFLPITGALS